MAHSVQSETRKKLLELFSEAKGDFISGQKISEILGCSRTAVWKHIEDLRKEGFELEAVRRLGYRIVNTPDKVTANEIQLGLKTETLGRYIHFEEEVTSTQTIAQKLAYEGAKEGTLVVAEQQIAGRGRMARNWFSPKGTGIWMSLILRPPIPPQKAPQLTLLTAVAIAQAIQDVTGLVPDIKWPNDILINGKKCVGILTELQAEPDRIHSVIIGMGINVNQTVEQFPEDIRAIATSLAIEKGEKIKRAELIQEILFKIEMLYRQYLQHGFRPIKLLWEGYAISIGKEITARTLSGTLRGMALGITDEGVLMLEDADGNIHYIHSADIQL
ncbi:biotin--[acetyl-CoA-carboxylase] ligase [Thermaerobacillus caldiproteolyticus]|uniref:biotin--[acetyl-CoA-carboxylase] ligase n=1 Tax=Thermaerobacillus caldiproteolyticus TaxID=247480 RepID=UPI00188AF4AB|nr:biotin--[acetyl-CoA-carboxylase] ligase [Anoxybacillus caldiproteolyticus]QPA32962.1 biotin--[acetyl-CoA-carboxylase] ligase [Anoxybacillus caldiproteolyticus]